MIARIFKRLLPDRPCPTKVLRGPFRGARILMNPRASLRKVMGLYEHELNAWLYQALPRVVRVLDVGANDGYFAFGCAAAFQRMGTAGEIVAYEPQTTHCNTLQNTISLQAPGQAKVRVVQALVGAKDNVTDTVTLDSSDAPDRNRTLIKIDVEGAELDVIAGALSWMKPSNLFLIEVHKESFLDSIPEIFASHGQKLVRVDQRPLPLLGREVRDESNWWLVSEIQQEQADAPSPSEEAISDRRV
jgi:hypothetical protein